MSDVKAYKGIGMEGGIARWYTRTRANPRQREQWRQQAHALVCEFPNTRVLEVAPGPGFFAIELAKRGLEVTGLDISRTFVEIARENAGASGVAIEFREGDAARMPFADASFDVVVCQAAFKNFSRPADAIREMHRVLRPNGVAIVQDLRKDASDADVRREVEAMELAPVNAFVTRTVLGALRRRALPREAFERLARASPFGGCSIASVGVGLEVRLHK